MKILEARSNPSLNPKKSAISQLKTLLSNTDIDNVYVSLRTQIHVSDINPNNEYSTPTGFYTYPLKYYRKFFNRVKDIDDFKELFPYGFERRYILFFEPNSSVVILENQSKSQLLPYANNILKQFPNPGTSTIINQYIKGKYTTNYTEPPVDKEEWEDWWDETEPEPVKATSDVHEFWLLIYDCATQISHYDSRYKGFKVNALFTIICKAIGIDGFQNTSNQGWIHRNEPSQAVFFKVKNAGKITVIDSHEKGQNTFSLKDELQKDPTILKWNNYDKELQSLSNEDISEILNSPKGYVLFPKLSKLPQVNLKHHTFDKFFSKHPEYKTT